MKIELKFYYHFFYNIVMKKSLYFAQHVHVLNIIVISMRNYLKINYYVTEDEKWMTFDITQQGLQWLDSDRVPQETSKSQKFV